MRGDREGLCAQEVLKVNTIKDCTQVRVVRKQLPNIYLTFTRNPQHKCSCPLTRVRKFFQRNLGECLLVVGLRDVIAWPTFESPP